MPRLRTFLPAPEGANYLLATDRRKPSPERIVGAAAWWPAGPAAPDQAAADVAFCRWRTTPRWEADGQSLPADLLDALTAEAVCGGVRLLRGIDLLPEDGPVATRLAARGWTVAFRNEFYEGRASATWPRVDALFRRLEESPEGAAALGRLRAGPPTPDVLPAVFALVSSKGLVPPDLLNYRLSSLDQTGGYSTLTSRVLLTTGASPALAAVLLMRMDATGATIDARVADPAICAEAGVSVGQANILLLRAVLANLRAVGVEILRYHAHPGDHRETINMARRLGAERVKALCAWEFALTPNSPPGDGQIFRFVVGS